MIELTAEREKTIRLFDPVHGLCVGCGDERDVTPLRVFEPHGTHGERPVGEVAICGRCISAALAIRFAAGTPDRDREMQL